MWQSRPMRARGLKRIKICDSLFKRQKEFKEMIQKVEPLRAKQRESEKVPESP